LRRHAWLGSRSRLASRSYFGHFCFDHGSTISRDQHFECLEWQLR
jgi:hypothetical protein